MKHLPDSNATSVQVCVGEINNERTPAIFLALYFINPSCVFHIIDPTLVDVPIFPEIGFPGAYIGQKVNKRGKLESRKQTNYYVLHSSDPHEIADVAFFAAKLHKIPDRDFHLFKSDLREFFRLSSTDYKHLLGNRWPCQSAIGSACELPFTFIRAAVGEVKSNLGLTELENKVFNLTAADKEKVLEVNKNTSKIVERYTITTSLDIEYRAPLEELLESS